MIVYKLRKMRTELLIEYAQSGVAEALDLIVERYKDMVFKISQDYFGIWAEKSDIIQNGFVGLMKAVYYYDIDKESNFNTFAWMNISSEMKTFLTYLNRKKNKVLSESVSIEEMAPENESGQSDEDASYYLMEKNEDLFKNPFEESFMVEKTLLELRGLVSEKEYEVFELFLKKFSYSEIAGRLALKRKKVDNTIQKCKKKFKEAYQKQQNEKERYDKWFKGEMK